jgi:hypothetical protein
MLRLRLKMEVKQINLKGQRKNLRLKHVAM